MRFPVPKSVALTSSIKANVSATIGEYGNKFKSVRLGCEPKSFSTPETGRHIAEVADSLGQKSLSRMLYAFENDHGSSSWSDGTEVLVTGCDCGKYRAHANDLY